MENTELTPQYDIVPHGVKKKADGIYYMVFKIIVTFDEFKAAGIINPSIWAAATHKINNLKWGCLISPNLIHFHDFEKDIHIPVQGTPVAFNVDMGNPYSFCFGKSYVANAFEFLSKETFRLGEPIAAETNFYQMEGEIQGDYDTILQNAQNYAKALKTEFEIKAAAKGYYDFTSIYASILDDTVIAEKGFGIVRTFYIPIDQTSKADILINSSYQIKIIDTLSTVDYYLKRAGTDTNPKFYNGLRERYFTNDRFKSIKILDHDAYKGKLAEGTPNPDGAYVMAIYNQDTNGVNDPFAEEGIKGFNAVANFEGKFYSLSYHKAKIAMKIGKGQILEYKTSGALMPRSVLLTNNGAYRNNLLLAWRGDNLLVNRINREEDDDFMENKITPMNLTEDEGIFKEKNLFTKTDSLVAGSQLQLLFSEKPYKFFARKVSVTGYCIPLTSEIDVSDLAYTLSMEDDLADTSDANNAQLKELNGSTIIDFTFVDRVRIKSCAIVGPKNYQTEQFADQHQQIVLDLENETQEKRYIYPPQIKFEDFRFLSYLTKEKLNQGNETLTVERFVERCIELEKKIKLRPRKLDNQIRSVNYLADPRGKFIYFYGNDFFTGSKIKAKSIKAFHYDDRYPFFSKTKTVEISVEHKAKKAFLKLNDISKTEFFPDLPKGIYNFNVYVTDGSITEIKSKNFNEVKLKISVIGIPDRPFTKNPDATIRNTEFKNYWFRELRLENSTAGYNSLKYLEISKVLKLQHDKHIVEKVLKDHYIKANSVKPELFNDEYPYEIFVDTEGGFKEENGLKTSIYPNHIKISYEVNFKKPLNGKFFSWRLNDEDILEARLDTERRIILSLGENDIIWGKADLEILFDQSINHFVIKDNITQKKFPLKQYVYQNMSLNDIKFTDEMLSYVQYGQDDFSNEYKFTIDGFGQYIFIADNQIPFYQEKQVKLFASSQFQDYHPKLKSEFSIGAVAEKEINCILFNNTKPEPPMLIQEKMFKHTIDDEWNGDLKESTTVSLVCLTLQQDFMKEGQNKLGIVLHTKKNESVSCVGEDITKLTKNDLLSALSVEKIISNKNGSALLKKYIAADHVKYYRINNITYKVLEFIPFYNTVLRKWQVVLSFDLLRSETMFMKLYTIKIAMGHGLKLLTDQKNSDENPYIDTTGTNLSVFSEPCEFPIFSKKRITVRKTSNETENIFRITRNLISDYKDNIVFIMLIDEDSEVNILNKTGIFNASKYDNLISFKYFTPTATGVISSEKGKILQISEFTEIAISRETCHSILVLEFEVYGNSNLDLTKLISFVELNPLYDNTGIRLIDAKEFKL